MPKQALPVQIPSCVEPQLRRQLDKLAKNNQEIMRPLAALVNNEGSVAISISYLIANEGDTFIETVLGSFLALGTLGAALVRGGTATLTVAAGGGGAASITVNGYLVKEDWQIPNGKRVCAVKIGGTWYAIATDDCLEEVPP